MVGNAIVMDTSLKFRYSFRNLQTSVNTNRVFVSTVAAVFLVTLAFSSHAGLFPGKQKFYTLKTQHFYIHYHDGIGPLAGDLRDIAEGVFERITSRLDWKPWGRTHVVMTDKTDISNGLASVIPDNYILLYIAPPTGDSTLDHYKDYLELLFTHEFTHIVHIDKHNRVASPGRWLFGKVVAPNGLTPAWMREGMAVYEESQIAPNYGRNNADYSDMVMRTAYYEGKFPRIDQIAGSSVHFPAGSGPYTFGGAFFEWLAARYGEDRMYKYQDEYASSLWLFALNNKARRVYGKSFYQLWREFKAELARRFEEEKSAITAQGLTALESVVKNKNSQNYFTPRPGGGHAYFESSFDEASAILIKDPSQPKPIQIKRSLFGQMSFSKSGRYLAFSSLSSVAPKTSHGEVFYYDLKEKKLFRVFEAGFKKKSMRAMDPDFSPADGGNRWIVMVRNMLNTDQLYVFDTFEKRGYFITNAPEKTQFSNPRFAPDGQRIVVSRKDPDGQRDIVVYSHLGFELKRLTSDDKPDNHPVFSRDGRVVYFDSFRTGISNIFEYDLKSDVERQVTNVLTGVFQPMVSPQDGAIYVKGYGSDRNAVFRFFPPPVAVSQRQRTGNAPSFSLSDVRYDGEEDAFYLNEDFFAASADGKRDGVYAFDFKQQWAFASEDEMIGADAGVTGEVALSDETAAIAEDEGDVLGKMYPITQKIPYHRFGLDPSDTDSLPTFAPPNAGRDTRRSDIFVKEKKADAKSKKSNAAAKTPQRKEFPSNYKSALQYQHHDIVVDTGHPTGARRHSPLPQLLIPRYLIPSLLTFEDAILAGFAIGKFDPLYRHSWTASVNYRSDARFVGGNAAYVYTRFDPVIYVGVLRYAVDWGDVNGTNFFEQRLRGYAGVAYVYKKSRFNLSYFYEDRQALTNLVGVNLINMRPYAGFQALYTLTDYKSYADSISQENGYKIKLGFEWANEMFGSDGVNEERVTYADLRYYLEMPWSNHHVLGFRVAGGWVWGDVQQFGTYRLGGPFGEGTGAGYSSRLFPMRGLAGITFGGDGVFIFSSEYRLPLIYNVNRGIGTWPIFLDKLYLALFVDGGDIKYRTELPDLFTRMMVAVGAELKGDFVLGYGLPMTMRAGYGVVLTNRDRIAGLVDPLLGTDLGFGTIYLQVGTAF